MALRVVVLHRSKRLDQDGHPRRPAAGAAARRRRREHDRGEEGAARGRGEGAVGRAAESAFDVAHVAALGWGGNTLHGQNGQRLVIDIADCFRNSYIV